MANRQFPRAALNQGLTIPVAKNRRRFLELGLTLLPTVATAQEPGPARPEALFDAEIKRSLAASSGKDQGAGRIGYDGGSVKDALDEAKTLQGYEALLAYRGTAVGVRITTPGIAGPFRYNRSLPNTTNGGTRFAHSSGKGAWERLFDGPVWLTWFGANGDWNGSTGSDDTAAIIAAINECKNAAVTDSSVLGGELSGKPLYIPPARGAYLCKSSLLIDRPITIVGDGQGRALNNQTSSRLFFQNSHGLVFTKDAYLFDIRGVRIDGVKKGGLLLEEPEASKRRFGNAALVFNDGLSRGRFENCQFNGFDIGKLGYGPSERTSTPGWAGAYKYFNYCGFLNCTYSVCNLDFVTDETYFQTYFRCDSTVDGYFLISAPYGGASYATLNLIGCMAEGICRKRDPQTPYFDFQARGFKLKGRTDVIITGGYYEFNTWFVDAGATLTSNAWLSPRYSDLFGGGGLINLNGSFANARTLDFPDLVQPYWNKTGLLHTGFSVVGDQYAEQLTVQGRGASLTGTDLAVDRRLAMSALPNSYREIFVMCEVEYHARAGVSLAPSITAKNANGKATTPSPESYATPGLYSGLEGWKRMTYTLPLPTLIDAKRIASISPAVLVFGAKSGDVISIRQLRYTVLSR